MRLSVADRIQAGGAGEADRRKCGFPHLFCPGASDQSRCGEMKGSICGVRLEDYRRSADAQYPLSGQADDDLAKGKTMDKILGRKPAVSQKVYEYDAVIHSVPDQDGAYVAFPWDIRQEFGRGRVKVHAAFDGIPYDGSVVNMGCNQRGRNCLLYHRNHKRNPKKAEKGSRGYCSCDDPGAGVKGCRPKAQAISS